MKRSRPLIAVLAASALVVAACGGDDEEPAADTATAEATATPDDSATATTEAAPATTAPAATTVPAETSAPAEPAEDALVIWADDTRTPVFQEFGVEFEAATGVPVQVVEVDFGTIKDQITQQGPAGEGADIIIGAHDWLGELVASGIVAPVDLPNAADFEQVTIDAFSYDGTLYGVPIAIENLGLFRNTELVPEPIADWNEIVTTVEGLVADGSVDVGVAVQNAPDPDVYHNYPLQTMYGSYIFGTNSDGSYNPSDLGIATDAGKAYAAAWKGWGDTKVIDPTLDSDTALAAFNEGRAAFYITGPWNTAAVRDSGVPFAIEAFPSYEGNQGAPFVGVQGIMINAFSEKGLLAQRFATEFMASQAAQDRLFELGGRAPALRSSLEAASASDETLSGFAAAGTAGQPLPAIPEMGAVWGNLQNGYKLILNGIDPAEAFQEAQDLITESIAS